MKSYLYPTHPNWFEKLLEDWKNDGKKFLAFPFLRFTPTTLPENKNASFWMYMYYSKTNTTEPDLQGVVKFRARVVSHVFSPNFSDIQSSNVHIHEDPSFVDLASEATVWFQCDLVEEIRKIDGGYLHDSDFKHSDGVALLQSARNSIPAIERVSSMAVVQTTWHCIND